MVFTFVIFWLVDILAHAIMIAYIPFTLFRMGLVWTGMGILMAILVRIEGCREGGNNV